MALELNEQEKAFLEELLAEEYEEDEENPKSATHRTIAYKLLTKLQE